MILEAPGIDAGALALRVAGHFGIPQVTLAANAQEEWASALAQELEPLSGTEGFLLLVDLQSADQAAELESILDRHNRPLKLVVSIDTVPDPSSAKSRSGYIGVCDYYRQRGLLRRVRSEGSAADQLATIRRIVDDLKRTQQTPIEDPFTTKLRAITDASPGGRAKPKSAKASATDAVKQPITNAQEPVESKQGAGWKHTAEQKGRIRRRAGSSKKGSGGHKPRGTPKP